MTKKRSEGRGNRCSICKKSSHSTQAHRMADLSSERIEKRANEPQEGAGTEPMDKLRETLTDEQHRLIGNWWNRIASIAHQSSPNEEQWKAIEAIAFALFKYIPAREAALRSETATRDGITLNLDIRTAGEIGLFEFLRSKGFEIKRDEATSDTPAGREPREESIEQRRARAKEWADTYEKRTGEGPGKSMYAQVWMSGYFNHPLTSSKGLNSVIIEQFEAALAGQAEEQPPRESD